MNSSPAGAALVRRTPTDASTSAGAAVGPCRLDDPGTPEADPASASRRPDDGDAIDGTVVVILAQVVPRAWAWGASRYLLARAQARRAPGLRFVKQLGSGFDGGFGLRPSLSRQALFCVFGSRPAAEAFADGPVVAAYRSRSDECATLVLRPVSSRGRWSGMALSAGAPAAPGAPVVALTRASIRPSQAWRFWRHAPPSEQALDAADGCVLSAGLGEAPLLRQATLTAWRDVEAMNAYARQGAHLAAIRASREGAFFSESMFVRFEPIRMAGCWKGRVLG